MNSKKCQFRINLIEVTKKLFLKNFKRVNYYVFHTSSKAFHEDVNNISLNWKTSNSASWGIH